MGGISKTQVLNQQEAAGMSKGKSLDGVGAEWARDFRVAHMNGPMCSPSEPTNQAIRAIDKQEGGNHYKKFKIQPIEFIQANKLSYAQGNVIKYICRYSDKGGKEDLLKAIHYIELMVEELKNE